MRYFALLFLLHFFLSAYCIRDFRLGRLKGGGIGIPGEYSGPLPLPQWFTQKLDHAHATDMRRWKQRYYVNDDFFDYNNPGPVFLLIGGDGAIDARWMVMGAWIEYAKKFNALCIQLEHRYYGESHPTSDLSVKHLRYLSSYQALADIAYFISVMNEKYQFSKNVKWVAFGGSYTGSLAAWLRVKYPHLVHAAVSSSAPLLAKPNFKEYFQVVVNALIEKTNSEDCINQVKLAHHQLVKLIDTNPKIIEEEFKVCKPFVEATPYDMKNFYNSIADDFARVVQYNEINMLNSKYRNLTIKAVCNILTEPGPDPAHTRLAKFNSIILGDSPCMDYSYDNMINELKDIKWSETEGARQWMYQTCTEFGFYQTSPREADVFGDTFYLSFFVKQCQDIFGKWFDNAFLSDSANWTNTFYGGLDIKVDRVIFIQGSVDPWHPLGVTEFLHPDAPAIFIPGTSHAADMFPSSHEDSRYLRAARIHIGKHLYKWLFDYE